MAHRDSNGDSNGDSQDSAMKEPVDPDLVERLAEILAANGLTEIEIEHKDLKLRVVRKHAPVAAQIAAPSAPAAPIPSTPAAPAQTSSAETAETESQKPDTAKAVPSPMVGTAYRSPEPGAKTFVEVGSDVREGQTILIIEAMKTMNAIPAPRAGKVTAIFVDDAQPVEYGEPLLVIE